MSQAYFNGQAGSWDDTVAEKDTAKLEYMVARFNLKPGSAILDVGTGTGILVPFLLRAVEKSGRIIGLDYAGMMLKQAAAKDYSGDITYILADIASIPVKAGSFEAVICYSCFPHFSEKLQVLSEIKRVLKPGGRLFICHTSSREHINRIHRHIPSVCHDLLPENEEMQQLLTGAGFERIFIEDEIDRYLAGAVRSEF